MKKLPDGYTPLEYIEYTPPAPHKLYILDGFKLKEDAEKRATELYNLSPSKEYKVLAKTKSAIEGYSILLPDMAVKNLSPVEKTRTILIPQQIEYKEYQPHLYRFIEEKYVDEFFDKGKLMLTTFKRCAKLDDSNRADSNEGRNKLIGQDRSMELQIDMSTGTNVVMFCTSLSKNNILPDTEPYQCCFEIIDINSFVNSITSSLLKQGLLIKTVIKGPCVYSEREIRRTLQPNVIENFVKETGTTQTVNFDSLFAIANAIGNVDVFFSKPLEKAFENEYRIVWILDNDAKFEQYMVTSPEATKVCRKIKF